MYIYIYIYIYKKLHTYIYRYIYIYIHIYIYMTGDTWWALMRLAKTDSTVIRDSFSNALYNLSYEYENMKPLRNHHILSYLKDVIQFGCKIEFLDTIILSVQNICLQVIIFFWVFIIFLFIYFEVICIF
jgi:hypothetical protein